MFETWRHQQFVNKMQLFYYEPKPRRSDFHAIILVDLAIS